MRGTKELDYFVFTDSLHAKNKHALSILSECLAQEFRKLFFQ